MRDLKQNRNYFCLRASKRFSVIAAVVSLGMASCSEDESDVQPERECTGVECDLVLDIDAGPSGECERWDFGEPTPLRFAPTDEDGVSYNSGDSWAGAMSDDELVLFTGTWSRDSRGESDIVAYRRESQDMPFGEPLFVEGTQRADMPIFLRSVDRTTAELFLTTRSDNVNGNVLVSGRVDLETLEIDDYVVYRDLMDRSDWINDLWIDSAGERMVLAKNFSTVVALDLVEGAWVENRVLLERSGIRNLTLSADGLELIYSVSGRSRIEIWYSSRSSVEGDFPTGRRLTKVHSDVIDDSLDSDFPVLSADGQSLYLNYNVNVGTGNSPGTRPWVARRQCADE